MIAYALAITIFLATLPVGAWARMMTWKSDFTWASASAHLALQAAIGAAMLWITSLLGPLSPWDIALTGIMLLVEGLFRAYRKWQNG